MPVYDTNGVTPSSSNSESNAAGQAQVNAGAGSDAQSQARCEPVPAAPSEKQQSFTKLALLIEDISADRYGRPLIAALHLCNDLADELESMKQLYGAACQQLQARGDNEVSLVSATGRITLWQLLRAMHHLDIAERFYPIPTPYSRFDQMMQHVFDVAKGMEESPTADKSSADKGQG